MSENESSQSVDSNAEEILDKFLSKIKPQDVLTTSVSSGQQYRLNEEKIKEQEQRRQYRSIMFWCFFGLLIGQHVLLLAFIICVTAVGALASLKVPLSIIIPATLGETYIIMKQMVKFIFQPGDFKLSEKSKKEE